MEAPQEQAKTLTPPGAGWMAHIDEICSGQWINPQTGDAAPHCGIRMIEIADSLEDREAELVRAAALEGKIAIVADESTWDAAGSRIASNLRKDGIVTTEAILAGCPRASLPEAEALGKRLDRFQSAIAVGSGTVNDLVKFTMAQNQRHYCVFGTAASMDGYTSKTASIFLPSGLKKSLPAQLPRGGFLDIDVIASAPSFLAAAGYGDCLCSSVARVDWWMSHRLLGTDFWPEPYLIAETEKSIFREIAPGIAACERVAVGYLIRSLVLSGIGVVFTGSSHHCSMGEHQISHYIDCFAGHRHPGSLHGAQVGLASLTMSRIQQWFLDQSTPPLLMPTKIDYDDMVQRMGAKIADQCIPEYRSKALDEDGAEKMNRRLAEIWSALRSECVEIVEATAAMKRSLGLAGGATTAVELGVPTDFYREAVRHGHEMRERFSFADLACDAGLLDEFAAAEV